MVITAREMSVEAARRYLARTDLTRECGSSAYTPTPWRNIGTGATESPPH